MAYKIIKTRLTGRGPGTGWAVSPPHPGSRAGRSSRRSVYSRDIYSKLAEAEAEVREGKVSDAREGLTALREKYGL